MEVPVPVRLPLATMIFLTVAEGDEGTDETGGFGQAAATMDFFMILPFVGSVCEVCEVSEVGRRGTTLDDKEEDEVADEGVALR